MSATAHMPQPRKCNVAEQNGMFTVSGMIQRDAHGLPQLPCMEMPNCTSFYFVVFLQYATGTWVLSEGCVFECAPMGFKRQKDTSFPRTIPLRTPPPNPPTHPASSSLLVGRCRD